jgi:multiple antibiotic resistance protein
MTSLSDLFTIFFLTLGPIKTIPAFYRLTAKATPKFRSHLALRATILATSASLFIAFFGRNTLTKWDVSPQAMQITGGLILFIYALKLITLQPQPTGGQKAEADSPLSLANSLAISPLTIPSIITPYGVVAILFYMFIARGNHILELQIVGMVLLMMLLNYLAMMFSYKIMGVIGVPALRLIGWIFAIMQASLAIELIIKALRSLGVVPVR